MGGPAENSQAEQEIPAISTQPCTPELSPGQFQIGLVGLDNVGKSALIHKFVYGEQLDEYTPTQYTVCSHEMEVDGKKITVRIGDAGGAMSSSEAMDKNIMESDGFIIVYDITRQDTFSEVQKIRAHLSSIKHMTMDPPMVLVGNKSDLNPTRDVLKNDGTKLGHAMRCAFFETSIITGENVNEIFQKIASDIQTKKANAQKKETSRGCCVLL